MLKAIMAIELVTLAKAINYSKQWKEFYFFWF